MRGRAIHNVPGSWVLRILGRTFFATFFVLFPQVGLAVDDVELTLAFSDVVTTSDDQRERAVAFRSLTFIDPEGRAIEELTFGTADALALQGGGWYEAEDDTSEGIIQWAGGPDAAATLHLTVPGGAEGIILRILGARDSLWVDVSIDGDPAATLRVDNYWHDGYIPLGDPIHDLPPDNEPEWIEGRYFPRFPETDRVYAITMRTNLEDHPVTWREHSRLDSAYLDMMALTLAGMQGIINRARPRVYFDWRRTTIRQPDRKWLTLLEDHLEVIRLELDPLSAFHFLWRRYGPLFDGAVLYDPSVANTVNIATMLAGLEDRVMLAPAQLALPGLPPFDSTTDLREQVAEHGWDNTDESQYAIYQWVYENLWPRLEKRIIGMISPGPPTSGHIGGDDYFPVSVAFRDYMVALRLPALWLNPSDEPEASLMATFLEEAPSPVPVTGVYRLYEPGTAELASRNGDWISAMSWPGPTISVGNLTVHSSIRTEITPAEPRIDPDRIMMTLGDEPLAAVLYTDGDATFYQMDGGFTPWEWVQGQHVGWTANMTMVDFAPVVWNYYAETRDVVNLFSGFSGAGYNAPRFVPEDELDVYLDRTGMYMRQTGLRTIYVNGENVPWSPELARTYYEKLREAGFLGSVMGNGAGLEGTTGFSYLGVPAPTLWTHDLMEESNWADLAAEISAVRAGEYDIALADFPGRHVGEALDDPDAGSGRAVRIDGLFTGGACCLAAAAGPLSLLPGDYVATLRLKVPDNTDTTDFIGIYPSGAALELGLEARLDLAPSDFDDASTYQTYELPFSVDRLTYPAELAIDMYGAPTDLYVDHVGLRRVGEPFPYAAVLRMLFLSAGNAPTGPDLPSRFAAAFEQQGGVVLTPDELVAAMNPEYMLEFAEFYVGESYPGLDSARTLLQEGHFFESLMATRAVLREGTGLSTPKPVELPQASELEPAFPNPFVGSTSLSFAIPESERVELTVYDLLGREVRRWPAAVYPAGRHVVNWDGRDAAGRDVAGGIYIYELATRSSRLTGKVVRLR